MGSEMCIRDRSGGSLLWAILFTGFARKFTPSAADPIWRRAPGASRSRRSGGATAGRSRRRRRVRPRARAPLHFPLEWILLNTTQFGEVPGRRGAAIGVALLAVEALIDAAEPVAHGAAEVALGAAGPGPEARGPIAARRAMSRARVSLCSSGTWWARRRRRSRAALACGCSEERFF